MHSRSLGGEDQVDFLSLLRGSALEEARLCTDGETREIDEIFDFLQEAYGEKRSRAQLL